MFKLGLVEAASPYALKLDCRYSKIKHVLTENTREASPRSEESALVLEHSWTSRDLFF